MAAGSSPNMPSFRITQAATEQFAPRLGELVTRHNALETPHYVANTSRGLVPHISQDIMRKHTDIRGVYLALEDFVEKYPTSTPAALAKNTDSGGSPLRDYTAMPQDQLIFLAARRCPPVESPMANTNAAVAMLTSVGFVLFDSQDYVDAVEKLQPDIVIGLGDVPAREKPGQRRRAKMSGRTEGWMREITNRKSAVREEEDNSLAKTPAIFAPILPIPLEEQSFYIEVLANELQESLSGLAIYDASYDTVLPEPLHHLPRLLLAKLSTPSQVLHNVSNGVDLFVLPFIATTTDAGVAMSFQFPAPDIESVSNTPLGIDMWSLHHAQDLSPLNARCKCYACTHHHRAYVHHLLTVKEMLAWVLLQIHNLHVMDAFFAGVRASIVAGTLDTDIQHFTRCYESAFPEMTGQGPRVRGYQFKAEGPNEPKRNARRYRNLAAEKAASADVNAPLPDAGVGAEELEMKGFAEAVEES